MKKLLCVALMFVFMSGPTHAMGDRPKYCSEDITYIQMNDTIFKVEEKISFLQYNQEIINDTCGSSLENPIRANTMHLRSEDNTYDFPEYPHEHHTKNPKLRDKVWVFLEFDVTGNTILTGGNAEQAYESFLKSMENELGQKLDTEALPTEGGFRVFKKPKNENLFNVFAADADLYSPSGVPTFSDACGLFAKGAFDCDLNVYLNDNLRVRILPVSFPNTPLKEWKNLYPLILEKIRSMQVHPITREQGE